MEGIVVDNHGASLARARVKYRNWSSSSVCQAFLRTLEICRRDDNGELPAAESSQSTNRRTAANDQANLQHKHQARSAVAKLFRAITMTPNTSASLLHNKTNGSSTESFATDSTQSTTTTTENKNTTHKTEDSDSYWFEPPPIMKAPMGKQHGKGGVFYGGSWLDIEDCAESFNAASKNCSGCDHQSACPRSQSRNYQALDAYDVLLIGAGCIGAAIARELAKYQLKVLWVEAADDVSQGATNGNSGIVHAGYDDKPGTNRAKYCWPGNQMFAQLDRELHFGYQINGSLVVAFNEEDMKHLEELKQRGETNGVKFLKIVDQKELRKMEPHISEKAIGALYSPDAGNVIPYVSTNRVLVRGLSFCMVITYSQ